ncbi:MAG: Gfo/Idh/MocA family protein [Clostridia bacterium]
MKAAVIGAGHMGRLHAQKLAALEGVQLVGIADPDGARAKEVASQTKSSPYGRYEELFGKAEAVVIAAPTDRHAEIARACLERGLHVLIEKPIAQSLREADELIALSKEKRTVLQVGHVERYNRAFAPLAARMDRPLFIESERLSAFKKRGAEVDVVLDLMIHDIDLALALARAPLTDVSACGFRVLTGDIDIANARLEFANGCVASLSASRVSQAAVRKLRVFQPDLYVSADLQVAKLRFVRRADGVIEQSTSAIHEWEESHAGGDALAAQAQAFVAAIRERRPVPVDGEAGRLALQVALDVGRRVRERLERFAK